MGIFKFAFLDSHSRSISHDVAFDLTTTTYPTRRTRRGHTPTPSLSPPPLPLEIVLDIIDLACELDAPYASLLKSCSLVCKDWALPAQRVLFRRVTIRSQSAYIAFHHAVERSTPRGSSLGDAVLSLRLVIDHNQPCRLTHRSFAHAVKLCPRLSVLDISVYGNPSSSTKSSSSFDETTLALLRAGPGVRSLRLSNWSDDRQLATQLLSVYSSTVRSLSLAGTTPELPVDETDSSPWRIEALQINCQTTPTIPFLEWLLCGSDLRTLDLERQPTVELLEFFTTKFVLERLSLPDYSMRGPVAALVQDCVALRELHIAGSLACKTIPSTLARLSFALNKETVLQPVLAAIKKNDELASVVVHLTSESHPKLASLKMACADRGVDLVVTRDAHTFRHSNRPSYAI